MQALGQSDGYYWQHIDRRHPRTHLNLGVIHFVLRRLHPVVLADRFLGNIRPMPFTAGGPHEIIVYCFVALRETREVLDGAQLGADGCEQVGAGDDGLVHRWFWFGLDRYSCYYCRISII